MKFRIYLLFSCLGAYLSFSALNAASTTQTKIKVISMTPHITEIILTLGTTNALVGISDYCNTPELTFPRCGGPLNPNFEKVLSLRPQLLFTLGKMEKIQRFAQEHQIKGITSYVDSFLELKNEILRVGSFLGKEKEATLLIQKLEIQLEAVRQKSKNYPSYKVFISTGREPGSLRRLYSVNGHTFISEMLSVAGGVNIFADQKQPYGPISKESLIARQPDLIIEFKDGNHWSEKNRHQMLQDWLLEPLIPAVKNQSIIFGTQDFLTIPGPRMVQIAEFFQEEFEKKSRTISLIKK